MWGFGPALVQQGILTFNLLPYQRRLSKIVIKCKFLFAGVEVGKQNANRRKVSKRALEELTRRLKIDIEFYNFIKRRFIALKKHFLL